MQHPVLAKAMLPCSLAVSDQMTVKPSLPLCFLTSVLLPHSVAFGGSISLVALFLIPTINPLIQAFITSCQDIYSGSCLPSLPPSLFSNLLSVAQVSNTQSSSGIKLLVVAFIVFPTSSPHTPTLC